MTPTYESILRNVCWFAGGLYGGVQEVGEKRWLVITEPDTRSTSYVPIDGAFTASAVLAKVQGIRRRYGR